MEPRALKHPRERMSTGTGVYLAGPFGVSLWGGVDWLGENSLIRGVVGTIAIGPVVRWRSN